MVEKLFNDDISPSDELYRIIRDEERGIKYKSYMEDLWLIYHLYADRDFPKQLAQDFDARFWEMYLTCTLVHNSVDVVPKQTGAGGPDIKIEQASTTIWVEAVTPTGGDSSKPDSVLEPRTGVAQEVPDDQIILRYRSAIHDKYFGKYFKYLEKGIIESDDCYIIALNGCRVPWPGSSSGLPRIIRCVLPFGQLAVTIDTSSHKIVNSSYRYREYLSKAGGGQVKTNIFTDSEYSNISAVMFSSVNVANRTPAMGDDFIIVRNPLASRELPDDFPKVGREYKAELSEETIRLFSKNLK